MPPRFLLDLENAFFRLLLNRLEIPPTCRPSLFLGGDDNLRDGGDDGGDNTIPPIVAAQLISPFYSTKDSVDDRYYCHGCLLDRARVRVMSAKTSKRKRALPKKKTCLHTSSALALAARRRRIVDCCYTTSLELSREVIPSCWTKAQQTTAPPRHHQQHSK